MVFVVARFRSFENLSGAHVGQFLVRQVCLCDTGVSLALGLLIEEDVAADDLAGGEITILDAPRHVVFIDGFAEVAQVVG
jgi:hypothetical protein